MLNTTIIKELKTLEIDTKNNVYKLNGETLNGATEINIRLTATGIPEVTIVMACTDMSIKIDNGKLTEI